MKEVTKKDLPEVSGGEFPQEGCIPYPVYPDPDDAGRVGRITPIIEPTIARDA